MIIIHFEHSNNSFNYSGHIANLFQCLKNRIRRKEVDVYDCLLKTDCRQKTICAIIRRMANVNKEQEEICYEREFKTNSKIRFRKIKR